MKKTKDDPILSVRESLDYLERKGQGRTEVYFRSLLSNGKIKSEKQKTARVIRQSELDLYLKKLGEKK